MAMAQLMLAPNVKKRRRAMQRLINAAAKEDSQLAQSFKHMKQNLHKERQAN